MQQRGQVDCMRAIVWGALILGVFLPSCRAIDCYKCKSEESQACTDKKPAGQPIPAANCPDPNKMFHDWLLGHSFMKAGFGNIDITKLLHAAEAETDKDAKLINVTGCALLVASSDNAVTKSLDKAASKTRSFFGDKKANEKLTVKTWVMRDCVTLTVREGADTEANRCVPVPGAKDVAKLYFCSCTSDKCNYPAEKTKTFIKESGNNVDEDNGSGKKLAAGGIVMAVVLFAYLLEM